MSAVVIESYPIGPGSKRVVSCIMGSEGYLEINQKICAPVVVISVVLAVH